MTTPRAGFSILELLVVLSIIGILMAVVVAGIGDSRAQARDAERQANLRIVENALELYKTQNGRYPPACDNRRNNVNPEWAGEAGTGFECGSGNEYIQGLAPEFIPELPRDPMAGQGGPSGYKYAVNVNGSVYKFMAWNTVESETLTNDPPGTESNHPFFRCGDFDNSEPSCLDSGFTITDFDDCVLYHTEMCDYSPESVSSLRTISDYEVFPSCTNPANYRSTYAISGGFATIDTTSDTAVEYYTERIRCQ